jgi:uncharacterized protein
MTLEGFFDRHKKAALGFSGGADSSYMLYAGLKCGAEVKPYYVNSAFQPEFELRDARSFAEKLGVSPTVLDVDILGFPEIVSNPADRCYYCKKRIFGTLAARAEKDGFDMIIDGTNASDDVLERAGFKAITEIKVRSPLRECGITKDEIRRGLKEAGFSVWDKPAYACLATRIPAGREITAELLERVEKTENALFDMGFKDFRARVSGERASSEAAVLQFPERQMSEAFEKRKALVKKVKAFFPKVYIDLEGRGEA